MNNKTISTIVDNNKTTNIMREILFRGLKADGSNEWVYGYYRKWFNSSDGKEVHIISNDYGEGNLVIPSTVGQFTGLTDKNGTRIFEGDKVSTDLQRDYNIIIYKNGAFMFECYDDNLYHDIFYPTTDLEKNTWPYGEVIGNIHQK